ncbi:MAG: glutamate mutase L [Anaerolineae bacterium]|nr:glutamate mutase L [Anaerolineae bacterium]
MESYLYADFGIAHTRTLLIDVVEGQYRFVSGTLTRTTIAPPVEDVTQGLERNINRLQTITGRAFLGQGDEAGFLDELILTASSAGRPLRAVLLGLMNDISLVSAHRALTGTYIDVVETISLIDSSTEEQRINRILRQNPDLIFIAGGTDFGNEEAVRSLVRLVELAVKLLPQGNRPIVLYGGNTALRGWVKKRLNEECALFIAENIRPELSEEALDSAKLMLAQVFDDFIKKQAGGFRQLSPFSKYGIVPTAQSAANLVRYFDSLEEGRGVLYLDVGSGTSALLANRGGVATADIRSTLGLGHSILSTLDLIDWRDVERWLPFNFSLEAYEEWVYNKSLSPLTIPQTFRDLLIEQGITREIVRLMVGEAREEWKALGSDIVDFSPVIVGGAVFTANLAPGLSALLILDSLQNAGAFDILLDPYGLAPALGVIGYTNPLAVVQVVENGGFVSLGRAYCPVGRAGPRGKARVKLTVEGQTTKKQIAPGEIWLPSIMPGKWVDVDIRLPRGMSMNGKRRVKERVRAGTAGLIFDMRGRPVRLPSGRRRKQTIADWFTTVTGLALDLEMLEAAEVEGAPDVAAMIGAVVSGISDEHFPDYKRLPDAPPAPDIQALFEAGTDEETEGAVDDLARELGLK